MIKRHSNKDLSCLNTFGMKVKAALYLTYDRKEDLLAIDWDSLPQPVLQMGSGSNLLFTGDFPGTVMHSAICEHEIDLSRTDADNVYVRFGAGVEFDDFCAWAAAEGYWGVENLSAIPGTVGASAVQNVGAYGVEAGDVIESVECFDISKRCFVTFTNDQCAFAYRDSFFKHHRGEYVVVSVLFKLLKGFAPQLEYGHLREEVERNASFMRPAADPYMLVIDPRSAEPKPMITPSLVRDTVRIIREQKLPDPNKVGSAGSFFKNPVVETGIYEVAVDIAKAARGEDAKVPHFELPDGMVKIPAAWLIEFCGFKGAKKGGAAVWENQPLVIVNAKGKASPADILGLEKEIIDRVKTIFGITLTPEVDHI